MACQIPYIRKAVLSETEKSRLEEIHVQIFKEAKESKAFREVDNRLQAVKAKYADATAFVGRMNQQYGPVSRLSSIGNGNAILSVNVLPVSPERQGEIFLSKAKERLSPAEYFEKRYNPSTRYTGPRDKQVWKKSLEDLKSSLEQAYVSEKPSDFGSQGFKALGKVGDPVPITLRFLENIKKNTAHSTTLDKPFAFKDANPKENEILGSFYNSLMTELKSVFGDKPLPKSIPNERLIQKLSEWLDNKYGLQTLDAPKTESPYGLYNILNSDAKNVSGGEVFIADKLHFPTIASGHNKLLGQSGISSNTLGWFIENFVNDDLFLYEFQSDIIPEIQSGEFNFTVEKFEEEEGPTQYVIIINKIPAIYIGADEIGNLREILNAVFDHFISNKTRTKLSAERAVREGGRTQPSRFTLVAEYLNAKGVMKLIDKTASEESSNPNVLYHFERVLGRKFEAIMSLLEHKRQTHYLSEFDPLQVSLDELEYNGYVFDRTQFFRTLNNLRKVNSSGKFTKKSTISQFFKEVRKGERVPGMQKFSQQLKEEYEKVNPGFREVYYEARSKAINEFFEKDVTEFFTPFIDDLEAGIRNQILQQEEGKQKITDGSTSINKLDVQKDYEYWYKIMFEKFLRIALKRAKDSGRNEVYLPTYASMKAIEGSGKTGMIYTAPQENIEEKLKKNVREKNDGWFILDDVQYITYEDRDKFRVYKKRSSSIEKDVIPSLEGTSIDENEYNTALSKYAKKKSVGPFYAALSKIKGINIQGLETPSWSTQPLLKVNIENLKTDSIERFQLSEIALPAVASPQVVKLSKELLEKMGVKYEPVKEVVVNGVKLGANGAALVTQALVQVVEGKEDIALPEESMHFAVEIIEQKNPKLFNRLLGEINDYEIYREVLAGYSKDPNYQTPDGKPDIRKLKKEAIAKQLVNTIINRMEEQSDTNEKVSRVQKWWKEILEFLRNMFISSGFDKAAMDIISGKNIGTIEDIREQISNSSADYVFLQKPSQEAIYNTIKDVHSKIEKKDEDYYIDGKKIPRRVSNLVQDWYERIFKEKQLTASEYDKAVYDLKAEKGTDGHGDLQNAFKLFVDENGFLRDVPLDDTGYKSLLNPNNRDMYELLRDNLEQRLKTFPPGTRFMSEVTIYDPKRGIAGTVDFLAITLDGKVNILDWKFMDLKVDKFKDVPWFKINAWRQQMDQYKLILEKAYAVRGQDFQQTRMVPIKAVYTEGNRKLNILPVLKSIKIGDVNVQNIKEDYLVPVGTETEKTGNKKIDALIEKLNSVYQKTSDKKVLPSEKAAKAEQLNSLFTAIRQLQMKQNLKPLLYQARVLNKQIQKVIEQYNTNWKGKDPRATEQVSISDFYEEIETAQNTIIHYTTLDTDLKFLFQGELSEEDKKLKDEVREVVDEARSLQSDLQEVGDNFTEEFVAGSEGVDSILSPEKIIKGITKWFSSTATLQIKSLETLYKKANKAFGLASMDTLDETKKLAALKQNYDKWAAGKGLTSKTYFDIIKKKDKNELINEFSPEFYKQLKAKIDEKDYTWIRENIDVPAYNKYLKDKLAEEIKRIEDKARVGTEAEINRLIAVEKLNAKNLYDVSTTESVGWLLYNDIRKFPKKDKWETTEWKELHKSENAPALAFYNYIKDRNEYYREIGYIHDKQARVFLPFVRKGLMEKVITGSMPAFGEQFLRAISIDEGDIGYGKVDPLTGRPIDVIPIYFTKEIEGELSTDLFRNMALYNEAAIRYKHVSDIEAQARALINVERNKKAIATSVFGKTVYKDGKIEYTPDNNENTKLVEDMVKAIIYGQRYIQSESFDQILGSIGNFGEKANKKLGVKIFPENLEGRQVSINKVITQLNNTFQINALGLNPLSALSNLLGGSFQSVINAETYFTKTDFMASELWLLVNKMTGKDQKKMIGALEYFLPLTDSYNKEIAKTLSLSKLSQENIQEFLMILMRKSDFFVQTANFYAFLNNTIVDGDRVVNVREFLREQEEFKDMYVGTAEQRKARKNKFESEVKRLLDEKGVMKLAKVEGDHLVIPGVDRRSNSVIEIRRKVQQVSKDALGNLSEDDLRNINMNIYGKSFMLFKNWIPRLVDVRMGNLKYNSASDAYEWGRMRMVFRVISDDLLNSLSNLANSLQGTDKGVEYMRQLFEKKKADYETETGKTLEMTEAEFMDLVRKNIRGQLVDALFMLSLFSIFLGLKALAPDDDEDEHVKNSHKFVLRAADKIKDELWFFYDPTSLTSLVSSGIFPSLGYINNFKRLVINFGKETYAVSTGDDEAAEKNYVIKYLMKTFPVTNQATQILPMFYPELAKDLGIRVSTEARAGAR